MHVHACGNFWSRPFSQGMIKVNLLYVVSMVMCIIIQHTSLKKTYKHFLVIKILKFDTL